MLSKKIIAESLLRIKINYSIDVSDTNLKIMTDTIFEICDDITDEQFNAATRKILKDGAELYGKLPPIAMFRELIFGKPLTTEELANKEVGEIIFSIDEGRINSTLPATLKTLEMMGGIRSLQWRTDPDNDNKQKLEWIRKEAKELWIANYKSDPASSNLTLHNSKALNDLTMSLSTQLSKKF